MWVSKSVASELQTFTDYVVWAIGGSRDRLPARATAALKLPTELRQWVELWHGFLPETHSFTTEEKARSSELPPFTHCTHSSGPFSDFLALLSEDTLSLKVTWPVGI